MVSGGGTNLQALIDGAADGRLEGAKLVLVISSKSGAYALERARKAGINTAVIEKSDYPGEPEKTNEILRALKEANTDLVVLAGYMSILDERVCSAYKDRIINIHPALLPRHGGVGYYGLRVHRAVLAAGDKETGATVHYVDEGGVDTGRIILQRSIKVRTDDTPESLQKRVLEEVEHPLIIEAANIVARKLNADRTDTF